ARLSRLVPRRARYPSAVASGLGPLLPADAPPPPRRLRAHLGGRMEQALITTAIDGFGQRLSAVDAGQWSAATPCEDWDVRTLVNHVVGELLWLPPLLEGKTVADVGDRLDGDIL